ncbi:MAG: polyisoprenoid-binding protein [Candidatus Krumholzibacteriota bacterium]|nr:polyisoprenoid-binding protein [Candidatus Krumholzibacteriota bacterium]
MKYRTICCALALVVVSALPSVAGDKYTIDAGHSSVTFSVKHMVISNVKGSFQKFEGAIVYDAKNMTASSVEFSIQTASIDTNNEKRDVDLRKNDFLDAENHPAITFKSEKVVKKGEGWMAVGKLTIRGVSKEIELPFAVNGPIQNPWGQTVIGVDVGSITINRQDYGVTWNKKMDNGGLIVGDEVTIEIQVEAKMSS